jgi:predicted TIM-barrel fold metal-dependent hydrolase
MLVDPPIIDCHAHIFTSRMPFAADAWTRPDYEYSVESYLADLDRYGISFGVIAAASLYGDYNDYTLWALQRHKRLRATIAPDPTADPATLQRLKEQGVTGVRLQFKERAGLPDFASFAYSKYLCRLADCGLHAQLNVSGAQLSQILPALKGRGVNIVVDHFGLLRSPAGMGGEGFQAVLRALEYGNVWVKISAGFRLEAGVAQAAAAQLLAAGGAERLLWGSDAPFVGKEQDVTYAGTLRMFQEIIPDPAIRRRLCATALRFYCF